MILHPTETDVANAAAECIKQTTVGGVPLKAKVVPRWILALTVGQVMTALQASADGGQINGWVLAVSSWVPSTVKSQSGQSVVPRNWIKGFDDLPGGYSPAADSVVGVDFKIRVEGSLKVWQLYKYDHGNDADNSELRCRAERGAVIDQISTKPRLGLPWANFEHDQLKMPSIGILPFNDSLLHIAQGNIPFSFDYVVTATE